MFASSFFSRINLIFLFFVLAQTEVVNIHTIHKPYFDIVTKGDIELYSCLVKNHQCESDLNFVDKQNEDIFTKLGECARNVAKENCKTFKENSQTTFQIAENELQMYKKLEFEKCFLPEREQQSEVLEELYTCAEEVDPCNQLIDAARKSGESLADYQDSGVNEFISQKENNEDEIINNDDDDDVNEGANKEQVPKPVSQIDLSAEEMKDEILERQKTEDPENAPILPARQNESTGETEDNEQNSEADQGQNDQIVQCQDFLSCLLLRLRSWVHWVFVQFSSS